MSSETTNPSAPPRLLLRPREAARSLGISERSLWSLTNHGEIPAVRFGRSVRYDLDTLRQVIAGKVQGEGRATKYGGQ
jgi:excisionase family DNA binding protein